jgi:alkane 1-monooxygenase
MIVLALAPPVWRRVMDHRVLAHYDGDATLANVHPSKRRRYVPGAGVKPAAEATS